MPNKEEICTAYHEAGHAVAAYIMHRRFKKVSIIPDLDSEGRCIYPAWGENFQPDIEMNGRVRARLEAAIITSFAGAIAEALVGGDGEPTGTDLIELADIVLVSAEYCRKLLED